MTPDELFIDYQIPGLEADLLDHILTHGKSYTPVLDPDDIVRGAVGTCFDTTAMNAAKLFPKYRYVEGIAMPFLAGHEWTLHAWLADDQGNAIDPTWSSRNSAGYRVPFPGVYFGIEMPVVKVITFMKQTRFQGVLANRFRMPQYANEIIGV